MPTTDYRLADGTKVPGTTTILGRFKESGALIRWAYKRGKQGLDLYASRDAAAEAGSFAHGLIDQSLGGPAVDPKTWDGASDDVKAAAIAGFEGYQRWAKSFAFVPLETECSLVSEKYRFGGTPDALANVQGLFCLVDWKTSNAVYADHILQLAAYSLLVEECRPQHGPIREFHLLRFDKRNASFHHHSWSLDNPAAANGFRSARRAFVNLRRAYDHLKLVGELV